MDKSTTEDIFFCLKPVWLFVFLLVGSVLLITVLGQVATIHQLDGWLWKMKPRPLHLGALGLTAILLIGMIWMIIKRQGPIRMLLFAVALVSQWGFLLSSGQGPGAMSRIASHSGHAEFAATASRFFAPEQVMPGLKPMAGIDGLESGKVVSNYEQLVALPSQRFSKSKPPGQLLGYLWLAKIAHKILPEQSNHPDRQSRLIDSPHRQLILMLTIVLPLLAACIVFPLYGLCRMLLPKHPHVPVLLFILGPSFSLVLMHFDQAVFPLICVSMWYAIARSMMQNSKSWAIAGGVLMWLASFMSFSTLPAIAFVPVLAISILPNDDYSRLVRNLAVTFGSALAMTLMLWVGWDYQPLLRFQNAMAFHELWKVPAWDWRIFRISVVVNSCEFLWWLGPPTAIVMLLGVVHGAWRLKRQPKQSLYRFATGFVLLLVALLLTGKTIGEVARLWIVLMPLAMIIAGAVLSRSMGSRRELWMMWFLWQICWTAAIKYGQDFF